MSITFYENALDTNTIDAVKSFASSERNCIPSTSWAHEIVPRCSTVLCKPLPIGLKNRVCVDIRRHGIFIDESLDKIVAAHYAWLPGSSIDWHTDSDYKVAMTVYINHEWDINWGGYFAYGIESGIRCVSPKYNLGIMVTASEPHSVLGISFHAPVRETIQIFVERDKT